LELHIDRGRTCKGGATGRRKTVIEASLLRMDNRTWYARMADLAGVACDCAAEAEADVLRAAMALLAAAPPGQRARFATLPSRGQFEALLAAGAGESAALALLPPDAAYIVSRGGAGVNLASVMVDGDDEEVAAEAATAGLALLAALAGALYHAAPLPVPAGEALATMAMARAGCLH
jgi:hypothetical protein